MKNRHLQQGNVVILIVGSLAILWALGLAIYMTAVVMPRHMRIEASAKTQLAAVMNSQGKDLETASLNKYVADCLKHQGGSQREVSEHQAGREIIQQCLEQARTQTTLSPKLIAQIYRQVTVLNNRE